MTRTIELNGSVLSKLSNGSTGGNVWFYSPGGIVIGSGAVFDVGGLLLSSIDLPNGFTAGTGNFSATFSKTQTNAGTIKILSGAQINARNSYVAVVAPRIEQGGNVQVNGSAAYAAADGLTMTMNQGLFNIQVPVGAGTSDGNGIVHTGTTGGSANAAASDHHSIYMVAVPKNQALAMLLGGSIGFAPAAQGATVENGQIVLSAGSSMNDLGQGHFGTAQAAANGNITIGTQGAATFTSTVYGLANGTIHADASSADITFARDATLESRDSPGSGDVSISATSGHQLTVGGNLDVTSSGSASSPVIGLSVNGGSIHVSGDASFTGGSNVLTNANLFAQNGSITIDGDASLDVSVDPFGLPATETNAGDVTGGNINITAGASGTITVGGFFLNADAFGQGNEGGGDLMGGDATGGAIRLIAQAGGAIQVNGDIDASTDGFGGAMYDGATKGGTGKGGTFSILASGAGSTVNLTDGLFASADGFGGDYVGEGIPTAATGGDGRGGFSFIQLDGGAFTAGGSFELTADAFGGAGRDGGLAFGGNAGVFGPGGSANLGPNLFLSATAFGGDANSGFGGRGGDATGGVAYIQADGTLANGNVAAAQSTITGGSAFLNVEASGGRGGDGNGTTIAAGRGGDGRGGVYNGTVASGGAFTLANTAGGTLTLTDVELFSAGFGGDGGDGGSGQIGGSGGDGYGGLSQAGTYNPLQSSSGVANFGNVILDSSASGGRGGIGDADNGGAPDGTGGNAFAGGTYVCAGSSGTCGGSVLNARGTVHVTGFAELISDASGGTGGIGGNAFGGFSVIHSLPNSLLDLAAGADLISTASGGSGTSTGGNATGGSSVAQADPGSTLTVHGFAFAESSAIGGSGATAGTATGGTVHVESTGGTLTFDGLESFGGIGLDAD